jgi:hypothetical protein
MATEKRKPPKPLTRTWVLDPHGMTCYVAPESYQTLTGLWETTELTAFHDAELARATKEINGILAALEKSNKDSTRTLSFVRFRNQQFLVWARYGAVAQWDEEKTIIKELKLKMK